MKLLLVDDEREICLLLNALLVRYGARTTMAHSLEQAREMLEKGPYDGIFLDVNLPDGKGYELIPSIRARSSDARVIVISAMDQEREHALAAGADIFLAKPLDRNTILGGMRKVELLDPEKEPN
jgi:two-component system, OmpR family, response regulator